MYAPQWKGADDYDDEARRAGSQVVRHPGTLMLPVPAVDDRMRRLIGEHGIETVWFGAAAPLALLGPSARRAGAARVLASTHGHEVGWSMLPVARSALRRIGDGTDVVTYVSRYTAVPLRRGVRAAGGPGAPAARRRHRPVPAGSGGPRASCVHRYGLGERPTVVCVSRLVPRKGQDMLIRALPGDPATGSTGPRW